MLKNYFKIAYRNLVKNKLYGLVNIGGLTIGITCCILIGIYIINELSYDRFNKNASRIVRVNTEYSLEGTVVKTAGTANIAGPRFTRMFPQIESFVRIMQSHEVVGYKNRLFDEQKFLYADSSFFKIFSFKLIEGSANDVLNGPDKIVITEAMKRKYFGDEEATGKILRVGRSDYIVTGVVENAPVNSQVKFDFIASFITLNEQEEWIHLNNFTYLLLHQDNEIATLEKNIIVYMKTQQKLLGLKSGDYVSFHLQPLTSVHLYSSSEGLAPTVAGLNPDGNIVYIYVLSIVALLILCIACVNYTNLATVQFAKRNAEIGIRKVLGAGKLQIFLQFIGESLLLTMLSLMLAVFAAIELLPVFNHITGNELQSAMLLNPGSLLIIFAGGIIISFVAGAYPAIILANFKLIRILKSGFSFSNNRGGFKSSLIVFQFMISVFLIISTVIILQQLFYLQHKNLGYDKEQIIVLPVDEQMRPNFDALEDAIKLAPNVKSVSAAFESPTFIHWDDAIRTDAGQELALQAMPVAPDIVQTLGLQIIAGNDFTLADKKENDTTYNSSSWHSFFILNETAVKALGWKPEEAIGKTIYRGNPGIVKAVVKDFNIASLQEPIRPLLIFLDPHYRHIHEIFVKVSGNDISTTLASILNIWKERVSHRPFEYHFLDDDYSALYKSEQHTAQIFSIFSSLAILLACLGLFALTAYTVMQRTKEIGIRKVLGASVKNIVGLLSKDFLKLVIAAIIVASPVAWLVTHWWLQSFAYRINIQWWVFIGASISVLIIALLTISFQAVKAAISNPVNNLRTE